MGCQIVNRRSILPRGFHGRMLAACGDQCSASNDPADGHATTNEPVLAHAADAATHAAATRWINQNAPAVPIR